MYKSKLTILTLLVGSLSIQMVSCQTKSKTLTVPELTEVVQHDKLYIDYSKSSNQLIESTINGKISVRNANKKLIDENLKNIKTLEELKELCRKAGVDGYEEFATLMYTQNQSAKALVAKYSELKSLAPSDRAKILKIKIEPSASAINSSAQTLLTNK